MTATPQINKTYGEGRFKLIREISRGDMGTVFEALDHKTPNKVLFKALNGEPRSFASNTRFEREIAVLKFLVSKEDPNIIKFIHSSDMFKNSAPPSQDFAWLVMEQIEGQSLSDVMKQLGAFAQNDVLEILEKVCAGLGLAHANGVAHRHLTPANIMLENPIQRPYKVKIIDWGLAFLFNADEHLASGGVGMPEYMPPEQSHQTREICGAADVWPLGLLAYEMLTGQSYWDKTPSKDAIALAPSASERAKSRGHANLIPNGFDAWFARCLAYRPEDRYKDATSAFSALEEILNPQQSTEHEDPMTRKAAEFRVDGQESVELRIPRTPKVPDPADPLRQANGILQNKIAVLQTTLREQTAQLEEVTQAKKELESTVAGVNEKLHDLQEEAKRSQDELGNLRTKNESLAKQVDELKSRLQEEAKRSQDELGNLRTKNEGSAKQVDELESRLVQSEQTRAPSKWKGWVMVGLVVVMSVVGLPRLYPRLPQNSPNDAVSSEVSDIRVRDGDRAGFVQHDVKKHSIEIIRRRTGPDEFDVMFYLNERQRKELLWVWRSAEGIEVRETSPGEWHIVAQAKPKRFRLVLDVQRIGRDNQHETVTSYYVDFSSKE